MLNTDASADSVIITIDNNTSRSSSDHNNDSRRRQRDHDGGTHQDDDNSSSSPSQRRPHHVMTQPVFLQLIFPFVPTKSLSTPLLFNSVSTSWSETIQHYSGAQLCWNALVRSGVVEKDDDEHDDDDAVRMNVKNDGVVIATRFSMLLYNVMTRGRLSRTSFCLPAALDTILMLPHETAKRIVAQQDKYLIDEVYRQKPSLQAVQKLFFVVERFEGADALKKRLEQINVRHVVECDQTISAHFIETLTRLGVDWKEFFSAASNLNSTRFRDVVRYCSSTQILKMVIDICRGVGDDFLKSHLERRRDQDGDKCESPLYHACHRKELAVNFLQILLNLLKELYGTTSEMFNRGVFTAKDFASGHYDRSAGDFVPAPEVVKVLVNASGVEQLFDPASSCTLLQLMAKRRWRNDKCDVECVRAVIDRCRELGGNELIRRQLELTGEKDEHLAFVGSFSPFQLKMVQYFIDVMKGFGVDFVKRHCWKTDEFGNTLVLEACLRKSSENLEYVLNDIFKANNFTDEEILAHFQHRNHAGENVLMLASGSFCSNDERFAKAKVELLTSELLRLQKASPRCQQPRPNSILKDMLEQESKNDKRYQTQCTPLMYALNTNNILQLEGRDTVVKLLFRLYRDDCSASVDEMKYHLRVSMRICFLKYSTTQHFPFLWNACLDFNDDVFLKSVLDWETSDRFHGEKHNVITCTCYREDVIQSVLVYLVKFDLFDKQYRAADDFTRTHYLARCGIDEKTPVRIELRREEVAHSETKYQLRITKTALKKAEDKLTANEEKLAAALTELSKLKEENF